MVFMKILKIESKNKITIVLGLLIIFISLFLLLNKYHNRKQIKIAEQNAIEVFLEENQDIEECIKTKEEINEEIINYIAVLEIPKISLKKGLVEINDTLNNVNKNIQILDETIFPNGENKSHIILAGHSGTARNAYFKNLNKLNIKDKIIFYYKDSKYTYEVYDIYEVKKTGEINLRQTAKSNITLITCVAGLNKQIVITAELISKDKF